MKELSQRLPVVWYPFKKYLSTSKMKQYVAWTYHIFYNMNAKVQNLGQWLPLGGEQKDKEPIDLNHW